MALLPFMINGQVNKDAAYVNAMLIDSLYHENLEFQNLYARLSGSTIKDRFINLRAFEYDFVVFENDMETLVVLDGTGNGGQMLNYLANGASLLPSHDTVTYQDEFRSFNQMINEVNNRILEACEPLQGKTIRITAHSAGGSGALIMAQRLKEYMLYAPTRGTPPEPPFLGIFRGQTTRPRIRNPQCRIEVMTFGEARSMFGLINVVQPDVHIRIVADPDVVEHMPPSGLNVSILLPVKIYRPNPLLIAQIVNSYRQTGRRYEIANDGTLTYAPTWAIPAGGIGIPATIQDLWSYGHIELVNHYMDTSYLIKTHAGRTAANFTEYEPYYRQFLTESMNKPSASAAVRQIIRDNLNTNQVVPTTINRGTSMLNANTQLTLRWAAQHIRFAGETDAQIREVIAWMEQQAARASATWEEVKWYLAAQARFAAEGGAVELAAQNILNWMTDLERDILRDLPATAARLQRLVTEANITDQEPPIAMPGPPIVDIEELPNIGGSVDNPPNWLPDNQVTPMGTTITPPLQTPVVPSTPAPNIMHGRRL